MGGENSPRVDPSLRRVECAVMRGGTSNAVFFRAEELPSDLGERDALILALMGNPQRSQIDGLGGGDPHTSKIAIVEESGPESDCDVHYTFGQVRLGRDTIDYDGNCGNISSAVGYYAIEEGMVEPASRITVRNVNNELVMTNEVPVTNGRPRATGDFSIDGVRGTGAKVNVGFRRPGGEITGSTLPLGTRDGLCIDGETFEYTVVDAAGQPSVFLHASDFGLSGTELAEEIETSAHQRLIDQIRKRAAVKAGIATDVDAADEMLQPLPVLVGPSQSYATREETQVRNDDVSLLVRRIVDGELHKSYAGTGAVCLGLASQIEGTIVAEYVGKEFRVSDRRKRITMGHPSGTMDALISTNESGDIEEVLYARTARRLFSGTAFVPEPAVDRRIR